MYKRQPIYGCLDPLASNYIEPTGDPSIDANTNDGTCIYNNDYNCIYPEPYNGNITGSNMSILFTQDFINSLPNFQQGSFIVAVNNDNISYGSVDVFGTNINALTIWGDDIGTPEIDGATEAEEIHLYLVNGYNLYEINSFNSISYASNSFHIFENSASVSTICSNGVIVNLDGCTDEQAINYNSLATNDDGSCLYDGCTYPQFYEYSQEYTIDNGNCENLIILGCTDSLYIEFNPLATQDDSSCIYLISRIQELENIEVLYDSLVIVNNHLNQLITPITIDLNVGWNMIGYSLNFPQSIVACLDTISDDIVVVKNNDGLMYWPEFGFNGIEDLLPGQGYQIYMTNQVDDFTFVDMEGLRIELNPTVPHWVYDLSLIHI